jgi:hypothetical protein
VKYLAIGYPALNSEAFSLADAIKTRKKRK